MWCFANMRSCFTICSTSSLNETRCCQPSWRRVFDGVVYQIVHFRLAEVAGVHLDQDTPGARLHFVATPTLKTAMNRVL
jgi:hypothetical protein